MDEKIHKKWHKYAKRNDIVTSWFIQEALEDEMVRK